MHYKTAKEMAEILGISKTRVNQLARTGRFGIGAYKKYSAELNYNGVWLIPYPNEYAKKEVGRPIQEKKTIVDF